VRDRSPGRKRSTLSHWEAWRADEIGDAGEILAARCS